MAFARLKNAWNAFFNRDPTEEYRQYVSIGRVYSSKPDRRRLSRGNERTIVTSIYNRFAVDTAEMNFHCAERDSDGRFLGEVQNGLNRCLQTEANIDQTPAAFIRDSILTMLDDGCVAIVPVDVFIQGNKSKAAVDMAMENGSYDVGSLRAGQITMWYPQHVRVKLYNDRTGEHQELTLSKSMVAIVENPFYAIMNEPSSTMQRLIRKLSILDAVDDKTSSGKLDLIFQLPYAIKSESRRKQAEIRRADLESQLENSKYGVGYVDATEKVIQLNRPVDNNLLSQIEYLTKLLFSQLGITQEILDGTATAQAMLYYYDRIVSPIATALTSEMTRKFLTENARTRGQCVMAFKDPFRTVPVSDIAEISDKLTRNEIATSNEIRQVIGWRPSSDPKADELRNKNIAQPAGEPQDNRASMPT